MDKVQQFFHLKELWKHTPEAERPAIDRELTDLLDGMTESEFDLLAQAIEAHGKKIFSFPATV